MEMTDEAEANLASYPSPSLIAPPPSDIAVDTSGFTLPPQHADLGTEIFGPNAVVTLSLPKDGQYPAPRATHDAILADKSLFLECLRTFHQQMGTHFSRIPQMGGKELDLQMLYKEVTARNGLAQVINERRWKEVTKPFKFPSTVTSASFVLRKYYTSLLHHFEQVYCFGAQGDYVPAPSLVQVFSPSDNRVGQSNGREDVLKSGDEGQTRRRRKRKLMDPGDPASYLGQAVTGSIQSKFDFGYFVTVTVGGEKMKGILYHPGAGHGGTFSSLAEQNSRLTGKQKRRRRRKSEMPSKDPNVPKSNRTAYNYFFKEWRAKFKELHPEVHDRDISKLVGEKWSGMTEEDRIPFQELASKDRERYDQQMQEYHLQLSGQLVASRDPPGTSEPEPLPLALGTAVEPEQAIADENMEAVETSAPNSSALPHDEEREETDHGMGQVPGAAQDLSQDVVNGEAGVTEQGISGTANPTRDDVHQVTDLVMEQGSSEVKDRAQDNLCEEAGLAVQQGPSETAAPAQDEMHQEAGFVVEQGPAESSGPVAAEALENDASLFNP